MMTKAQYLAWATRTQGLDREDAEAEWERLVSEAASGRKEVCAETGQVVRLLVLISHTTVWESVGTQRRQELTVARQGNVPS